MKQGGDISAQKERLRRLRKMKMLSTEEMGKILEVSKQTVYWYESSLNDNFLNERKLSKLTQGTGVRREWILEGKEPVFSDEKQSIVSLSQSNQSIRQTFELQLNPNTTEIVITLRRG